MRATATAPPDTRQQPQHWPLWYVLPFIAALPTAPRLARTHVSHALRMWGLRHFEDDATLFASELVTNAVQAATDPAGRPLYISGRLSLIQVSLFTNRRHLVICVYDQAPGTPHQQPPDDTAEAGRGLDMIASLGGWDWHQAQGGKVVRAFLETAA